MVFWSFGCGLILGVIAMWGGYRFLVKKQEEKKIRIEKDKVDITLEDIIRLAALNTTLDVSSLIIGYKINIKSPEFYEKYQALNKREKDMYFRELINIFSKNRREYVQDLFDRYSGLSTQDVLLLLMSEMKLDNKTLARIMGLSPGALKKRKTRLKPKLQTGLHVVKEDITD